MYYDYTQEELRAYCRNSIESLEIWARRLVDEKMSEAYGSNYIDVVLDNGQPLVKSEIRKHVCKMLESDPGRFKKPVDTLFLDQIVYFLCNQSWYSALFKSALDYAYPQGCAEAREFLNRLIPIRNPLSHSNPISLRQAEQAICYSHDFIDGLKQYYKNRGEEQVWNVPRIIKITDSFGNQFENPSDWRYGGSNFTIPQALYPSESYNVHVVVDPAFSSDEYTIQWKANGNIREEYTDSDQFNIVFNVKDVCSSYSITCVITSKKDWHKYQYYDCEVSMGLTILPPV